MMKTHGVLITKILQASNLSPVLVDIGASGDPPHVWQPLGKQATYIGFDPDEREIHDVADGIFGRSVIINKAVTDKIDEETVKFYLTKSPYCSSTLKPNQATLNHYLYADLFNVEREVEVQATTLNHIAEQFTLDRIDWIKLDSQGVDLRLLDSINDTLFNQVMAVDIEPGLIPFYEDENLFTDLHSYLTDKGFWLSDMKVKGSARMQVKNLKALQPDSLKQQDFERRMKHTPGWVEARYLRNLNHITTRDEHLILWAFALLDQQIGFALDVALQMKAQLGDDAISQKMIEGTLNLHHPSLAQQLINNLRQLLPTSIKQQLKTFMSS